MIGRARTLVLAVALVACSKATQESGAASDLATPAGLTSMITSKLGISEAQASAALGALLGEAQGKLSPGDYSKLEGALPGAEHFLSVAQGAGALPSTHEVAAAAPSADAAPPAPQAEAAATAAGPAAGPSGLNAALAKIGLPPEAASQFVPVVTEYVGKVAGPDVANILKTAFPA